MKEITAAIPTYNGAHRIARALASIRGQTQPPEEVLIIDDASEDDLTPLLQLFADLPIRVCRHERNRRDSGARNTAMREARGDFVAFLDDDDEWLPNKLAVQCALLEQQSRDAIAFCSYIRHHLASGEEELISPKPQNWRRHFLYFGGLGSGTTMMLSRDAFERVGLFDESMPRLSDCDWLLRAHEAGMTFCFTEKPQARVFFTQARGGDATERAARIFLEKHHGLYRKEGRLFGMRARASILTRIAERYAAEGRWRDALRLGFEASFTHPPLVVAKMMRAAWRTSHMRS